MEINNPVKKREKTAGASWTFGRGENGQDGEKKERSCHGSLPV
jgi:hypothetical protein